MTSIHKFRRHITQIARLALPAAFMRVGLLGLAVVDTAMVGHYATSHLAWLNLANQSILMVVLVLGMGLLAGIPVYAANAKGKDGPGSAGRVWRRNIPYSISIGLGLVAVAWPAEELFALMGQPETTATNSGKIVTILLLGVPAHMVFVCCTSFLEGIGRSKPGFYLTIAANFVNLGMNYLLIFGNVGAPELGAVGSAWSSTIVRWFLALSAVGFLLFHPSLKQYMLTAPHGQTWREWQDQRRMGFSSALSLAAEVLAFSIVAVFAGWLGTTPMAAHGIVFQVIGVPLMFSIGIGITTSARVSFSLGQLKPQTATSEALCGMILNFAMVSITAILLLVFNQTTIAVFTEDPSASALLASATLIYVSLMLFDAMQMATAMILRGFHDTWWPTILQTLAYLIVMLPTCYMLGFIHGLGWKGLLIGLAIGGASSWMLLFSRFLFLSTKHMPAEY